MIDEIIEALDKFVPFPEDDILNDNESYLHTLMESWKIASDKQKAIPAIFKLIERYPHADFGSPGPLVHALETTDYQNQIHSSLMRKPTPLTLWMYNRIINAETDYCIKMAYIERLKLFCKHPYADDETRKEAEDFLRYQLDHL